MASKYPISQDSEATGLRIANGTDLIARLERRPPSVAPAADTWARPSTQAEAQFPVRVPAAFAQQIDASDPDDPLLRQVWPDSREADAHNGYVADPVGDGDAEVVPGVLRKYAGRALLITTGACAIHCRYCFRRHFPYSDHHAGRRGWQAAVDYLAEQEDVSEVILSGGDPLMLSNRRLTDLSTALARIPHIRRLRIHSRVPVVMPVRIDDGLLEWLADPRFQWVMVIHVNHPRELGDAGRGALQRLGMLPITLLNQAVLLRGVNDQVPTLMALSEALFDSGVLPYYLHQLDPVAGAAHFQISDARARQLHEQLRAQLPGYLVPRLVCEKPGASAKTPL